MDLEGVRRQANAALERHLGTWAAEVVAGEAPDRALLSIPLKPPTETEVLADQRAAEAWARSWAAWTPPPGVEVEWVARSWRSIGRQQVPVRVRMQHADAVADVARGTARREWVVLRSRAAMIADRLDVSGRSTGSLASVVKRHGMRILRYPDDEFAQVLGVAEWVVDNPVTGLRPRQVPVRGVDSKWLGRHASLVRDLVAAVTGEPDLGLVTSDPLVRLRILDESLAVAGLRDVAAPPAQVASLPLAPSGVIIMENLESVLAMPPLAGAVVFHGAGFAVDVVAQLPWVLAVPVLYWGDLDSHGFAILHRLRSGHPDVRSVLMDEHTLVSHRDLWVPEPSPTRGVFPSLTTDEAATLARLRHEGDVRLEQERLPWRMALQSVTAAWSEMSVGADGPRRRGP